MIKIEGLCKKYGDKVALNNLNVQINDGEIFGLIGHNGAGKSTTIKTLVSIINSDKGKIFIDDKNLSENRKEIKKSIGYVSDTPDLFLKLPVKGYWDFVSKVFGIDDKVKEERIEELKKVFSIDEKFDCTIEELSHGMRQKVFIVGALISNPKIWILDEPMTGLDPQSAFNLKKLMREHTSKGNIVLFSTHVLEVAETLCDRICILKDGKALFIGTIEELKNKNIGDTLEEIYLKIVNEEGVISE